jgi:hypothetical protein
MRVNSEKIGKKSKIGKKQIIGKKQENYQKVLKVQSNYNHHIFKPFMLITGKLFLRDQATVMRSRIQLKTEVLPPKKE